MAGFEGRGSAGRAAVVAIVVAVGLLAMAPAAYGADHIVGGTPMEWTIPTANSGYTYDGNWSSLQKFVVGDTLEFKYAQNAHNVVQYATAAEYTACSGATVQMWSTGDDTITLNSTGTKYYICGIPGHCGEGMKVSVTVVAATAPAAAPTAAPTTTPTTPSPPPPTPTTPTTPNGNGATSGPALSIAGLLAAALVAGFALLV